MKILYSFSLQGNDPKYTGGVEANFKALRKCFGDSVDMIVYSPMNPNKYVKSPDNVNILWAPRTEQLDLSCHLWRFEAITMATYDYVCIRDIDSLISEREYHAVKAWMDSGKTYHCMRDHYYHTHGGGAKFPVQGGLWGAVPKQVHPRFGPLLNYWLKNKQPFVRYSDMWFLNRYVYPYMLTDGIQHDGCGSHWPGIPFPTPREGEHYVGEYAQWE